MVSKVTDVRIFTHHRGRFALRPIMVLHSENPVTFDSLTDLAMSCGGVISPLEKLDSVRTAKDTSMVVGPGTLLLTLGEWQILAEQKSPEWRRDCYDRGRMIVMPFLGSAEQTCTATERGFGNRLVLSVPARFTRTDPCLENAV
jgi:hypothetical protein